MKVALIGLGKMGIEIAGNLMRSGHQLTVYNRTPGKAKDLQSNGAKVASTPKEAVSDAEAVFTLVLDDPAFEAVTFGRDGILEALGEGAVHAGLSTLSIELAKRLAKEHSQRNRAYVGAPVLGRPEAAREAKLIIMAGGAPDAIAKLQPIFDVIARITFTAGPEAWHAALFKLCGNFMLSSMLETFGEAQALVRKAGLDATEFVGVMTELWGSPVYKNYGMLIANGKYDPPGGTLALGLKDNRLVLDAGRELSVPLPVAIVVRDQMLAAIAAGNAELDWASLSDTAFRNAGLSPNRT